MALRLVKSGIREVYRKPFFLFPPAIIMHQIHFGSERLSAAELRVLHEIATLAGGNPVHIWQGAPLAPEDILGKKLLQ